MEINTFFILSSDKTASMELPQLIERSRTARVLHDSTTTQSILTNDQIIPNYDIL